MTLIIFTISVPIVFDSVEDTSENASLIAEVDEEYILTHIA